MWKSVLTLLNKGFDEGGKTILQTLQKGFTSKCEKPHIIPVYK